MFDADLGERGTTVTAGGVTVRKEFEPEEFPVPAIRLELTADRESPAEVRLVDAVPEGSTIDFHPEYGREHWQAEDDRVVYERELEPEETVVTIYGFDADGDEAAEPFLGEPELTVDGHGPVDADGDEAAGSEGEAEPGVDDDPAAVIEAAEPETGGASVDRPGEDGTGSVVGAALAAELREEALAEADRDLLTEAFAGGTEAEGTVGASAATRIARLESQVGSLEAYIDALEEFIDENGPARELLSELRETVDDLDDRSAANEGAVDRLTQDAEGFENRLDALESTFESVEADLEGVRRTVETVDDRVDRVERTVEDIESGFDERVEACLEEQAEGLADDVERDVHRRLDARFVDLEGDVDDVSADVAELERWRSQLSSFMAGGGAGADSADE